MALYLLALLSTTCLLGLASGSLSDFTKLPSTDVTPCAPPCTRVGGCGNYPPNPNGPCNLTYIAEQCTATYGCVAFNTNGWLKGCGNVSCGVTFEDVPGTDTYVNTSSGGMPPPPAPCPSYIVPVEDVHYPTEEVEEAAGAAAPSVVSIGASWAVLGDPTSSSPPLNVTPGSWAFGFLVLAILPPGTPHPQSLVVVERTFARWGFLAYVSPSSGEVARVRKGVGEAANLVMPRYSYLGDETCGYYSNVYNNATDFIKGEMLREGDGEASFLKAAKYLPPQRDYASIGGIWTYHKFSVSPDGRLKIADSDIYTPTNAANESQPGTLVFDPKDYVGGLGGQWPATNWTFTKSALLGRHLRVVGVVGYDYDSGYGFEEIAFAPASEPTASAYVRLRVSEEGEWGASGFAYYNVSSFFPPHPLNPNDFYTGLYLEQSLWNATLAPTTAYTLPGREGARQVDTTAAALITSLSLYVGLQPNYGDGADYWSPQVDRGGSLPFQEIAVVQNLVDIGLPDAAGQRLGWWMDAYLKADGEISTGDWEDSCPGEFADGLADYGEMIDMFVRVARAQLSGNPANGTQWLTAHVAQGWRLMNYSYHLRLSAVARGDGNVTKGLIWGSPEHDTCHSPGYYYHNNVWFWRGLVEGGKFLRDVCADPAIAPICGPLQPWGAVFLAEAGRFREDLEASLALSATFDPTTGAPLFIPPLAIPSYPPFKSMIESTVAMYSNFRYYAELLGADFLSPAMSVALQEFRETHQGTVSGIMRWSDHLDSMPSSYNAAAALRDGRVPSFLALMYGNMANYQGRGTGTATEQLPINGDANGLSRDYLWGYLEGGIDQCIPSIMLPAIATRWQFVLERYDEDTLYLAAGAPRRWFDPLGGGVAIQRAATRFGSVDLSMSNSVGVGGVGEDVSAQVTFTPYAFAPGVNATPAFSLRLKASNPALGLQAGSVVVSGGGVLMGVDTLTERVLVGLSGPSHSFSVKAQMR